MITRRHFLQLSSVALLESLTSKVQAHPPVPKKVVVFSGHTAKGGNKGALSCQGRYEFVYNDEVVKRLGEKSNHSLDYYPVLATSNVHLYQRPQMAQRIQADAYLEIHHDSMLQRYREQMRDVPANDQRWQEFGGFSLYYYPDNIFARQSRQLAERIADELLIFLHPDSYHYTHEGLQVVDKLRAVYSRNLYVNRHARMPSVVVECGSIVKPAEEAFLSRSETRQRLAESIAVGVRKFFNL